MERMMITVELGPFPGAPYANWGVYEIGTEALERLLEGQAEGLQADNADLYAALDEADGGVDPFGSFTDRITKVVRSMASAYELGQRPDNLSLELPSCAWEDEGGAEACITFDLTVNINPTYTSYEE